MLPLFTLLGFNLHAENLLLLASVLVFFAILITKVGARFGAPSLLLFLLLGMAAGADGLGVTFQDYETAESIGHFAMTVILFTGGLETSMKETQAVMRQGVLLSTAGVLLMTVLTGLFIYFVTRSGLGLPQTSLIVCFLLAAILSSTDSASVFSVLRTRRLQLRENLGPLLELESGSNDPMAYLLTILIVQLLSVAKEQGTMVASLSALLLLVLQMAIGYGLGILLGKAAKWVLERIKLSSSSLYAILILSIAFFSNGISNLLFGNGLLTLYIVGIMVGNSDKLQYKKDVLKFFDAMTWLMQLLMFLMLGLLARPSEMGSVLLPALLIGVFMMFIARPVSVFFTLLPFRSMSARAKALVSWVGLKGAGPILFALYPVVTRVEGASYIFNIVFCITLLSLLVQGMSLRPAARILKLSYEEEPEVETFGLEVPEEMGMLRNHVVTAEDLERAQDLRELHLPHGIRVVMVRRDDKFLVPHGSMKLQEGDQLVIMMGETDD